MRNLFPLSKIFLYSLISFIIGVFLGQYFYIPWFNLPHRQAGLPHWQAGLLHWQAGLLHRQAGCSTCLPVGQVVLLFLVFYFILLKNKSCQKLLSCFLVFLLFCFLGIWRYHSFLPKINENHIEFYNDTNQEYQIQGLVSSEPDIREHIIKIQISKTCLTLPHPASSPCLALPRPASPCLALPRPASPAGRRQAGGRQAAGRRQTDGRQAADRRQADGRRVKMQNDNLKFKNIDGKILLNLPLYTDIQYGDIISFQAKLTEPKEYEDFSYKNYLARYGVYSVAKNIDNLEILERNKGSWFLAGLYKIKNYFSSIIEKIFPEPHASFMLGLLIGAKKSLPSWLLEIFKITGITHIIAISGYNISILARIAEKFLGRIGRRYIFGGVLFLVSLFVILTGAQATIVRAGIMGTLLAFAGFVGRKGQSIILLVFAGAVMVFLNPLILFYDIGFQLSFLATLGLIYLSPVLEQFFWRVPLLVREPLVATFSAQALTLPLIMTTFGVLSLIAPLANVLILSFIPPAMFFGFLAGMLGIIWLPLGQIAGFFAYVILEIIIQITIFLSKIPYAALEIKFDNWWILGGYYLLIAGILIGRRKYADIKSIKK